ncbi:MAG: 50S ribosomal protein L13 [Candidatus Aenigmarchaeota archaeon]|nr:50S ribosomal protein L13 [Candidatus Aenigmarchaeota archaeon]
MLIDGKNAVLGRLSAYTAKELLKGETVEIMNAKKIIIIGNPKKIVSDYLKRREIGSPHHGPFFPRNPEMIVRRAIRGMLPYKTKRGREAMKRLRVYSSELETKETAKSVALKEVKTDYITIEKLSKELGWNK